MCDAPIARITGFVLIKDIRRSAGITGCVLDKDIRRSATPFGTTPLLLLLFSQLTLVKKSRVRGDTKVLEP